MKTKFSIKKVALVGGVIILLSSLIPIAETLRAQKKDNNDDQNKDNQPKVDIHVKKQRDQNGNIIGYDSTYTWSWSDNGKMPANVDSVFKSMHERFSKSFSFKTDPFHSMPFGFRSPALKDSSSKALDPFNDMFGDDWADMDKMMQQHQKMMEEFFQQEPLLKVPDGVGKPAPKQKEEKKQKEDKKKETIKKEEKTDKIIQL